ncbi:hypothetical protein [Corynebacterium aquilae]|uniref:Oxidoreductase n=1 Tax=Corynebacterium aquilae DSM 44791 TaxID=1431546 RepID=A0A1L7CDF5_9CORY|nr:hypothetical protein [Corynebacterium aquilae]APT83875.1 hypothetical protein CAQU_00905 [Corynebacterium aquilae DSM 44791]
MAFQLPLENIASHPETRAAIAAARDAVGAASRVPTVIRRPDFYSAHAAKQAAQASCKLDPGGSVASVLEVFGMVDEAAARRLRTQPLAVLARMDVVLGGNGTPVSRPDAVLAVPAVIRAGGDGFFATAATHALIASAKPFGPRSGHIARAAARVVALHTGADPHNIAHTESFLSRHPDSYRQMLAGACDEAGMRAVVVGYLDAMASGALAAQRLAQAG